MEVGQVFYRVMHGNMSPKLGYVVVLDMDDEFVYYVYDDYQIDVWLANLLNKTNPFWFGSRICVKKHLKSPQKKILKNSYYFVHF